MKHMLLAAPLLVALAIFAATPALAQDVEIGVAAAINPDVTGTPPDQEKRLLLVGPNVFHNERVVTGEKGQTQMLFVDQSALTIGPDSEVVLDEFVYDPDTETGTIVLNATKGLFRLVGGKISKDGPVVLNTPTATIGIRGGIILVNVAETGATEATFLFGQSMQITSANVTREVTRPGFAVSVIAADLAPSNPAPVSADSFEAALSGLEGSEGESGGAEDTPEDSDVADSGIGEAGSDQDPAVVEPPREPLTVAELEVLGNIDNDAEDTAEHDEASQDTATESSTSVNVSNLSGRYKHSNSGGSSLGTGDGSSTFDVAYSGGAITSGTFSVDALSLTPFLKIPGITVGSFSFANAGTTSQFGSINGTGFLTSDQEFVFFEFFEADFSGDRLVAFAGVPSNTFTTTTLNALGTKFYALQNDFVLDSSIPFVQKALGGSLTPGEAEGAADTAIVFDASGSTTAHRAWGHRTIAIVGQGSSQTSASSLAGGLALLDSSNRLFLQGDVFATSRLSSTGAVNVIDGGLATVDDALSNDFFGGTAPDYFVLDGTKVDTTDTFVSRGLTPATGAGADQTAFFPNSVALVWAVKRSAPAQRARCSAIPAAPCKPTPREVRRRVPRRCSATRTAIPLTSWSSPAPRPTSYSPISMSSGSPSAAVPRSQRRLAKSC